MLLAGKTCIITGGTRGIGFSVAKKFLDEGANICVCGSRQETADHAINRLLELGYDQNKIMGLGINLKDQTNLNAMADAVLKRFGAIDVLVNNAGISNHECICDTTLEQFMDELAINTGGVFGCIKAVYPYMKENGGSIINTSSLVTKNGSLNQAGYVASKCAVNGLTKALARDLGKYKIRVNAVAPGMIETDMLENTNPEHIRRLEMMTPLNHIGNPNDLTGAYVYLASDELANFTTGTIIEVDGGLVL